MAAIAKRRGAYYVDYHDPTGGRRQKRCRTKAEAEQWFKDHVPGLAARRRPGGGHAAATTVAEWGAHFLAQMRPPALKARAWEKHEDSFRRFIAPALGAVRVVDLRRRDVRAFLLDVQANGRAPCQRRSCVTARASDPRTRCPHAAEPLAPGSVRIVYSAVRAILQLAVEDELIAGNPAARLGRSRGLRLEPTTTERQQRVEVRVPPPEEVTRLLEHTRSVPRDRRWFPVVLTMPRAGLRLGEIAGLQVDDFNPHGPSLHVRRAVNKKTGRVETPKHGTRVVDLSPSPELVAVLRAQVTGLRKRALKTGTPLAPWLFPTADGTHLGPHNIDRKSVV